jgi:hypothetical protein
MDEKVFIDVEYMRRSDQINIWWGVLLFMLMSLGSSIIAAYRPAWPESRWLYSQCPTSNWVPNANANIFVWYPNVSDSATTTQSVV